MCDTFCNNNITFGVIKMVFEAIGYVKNEYTKISEKPEISKIILNEKYEQALDGISEFSHIVVVFAFNKVIEKKENTVLKRHARGREDMPLVGIFSLRTPYRPNPIGITTVKLVSAEKNVLTVKGLDAYDDTPVLDIKPYSEIFDLVKDAKFPQWNRKLSESTKNK